MEFNSNKSIFLQIADNISEQVLNGTYPPGEKIPSVRELAAEMGVNPNTIVRTYNELQSLKIVDNKRGIGYFVTTQAPKIIKERKKTTFFNKILPEVSRQASLLGISTKEIKMRLDQALTVT
ncbi:MAG: GntR family transcriptional regulator [Cyclobacteriaceae bacterium]